MSSLTFNEWRTTRLKAELRNLDRRIQDEIACAKTIMEMNPGVTRDEALRVARKDYNPR